MIASSANAAAASASASGPEPRGPKKRGRGEEEQQQQQERQQQSIIMPVLTSSPSSIVDDLAHESWEYGRFSLCWREFRPCVVRRAASAAILREAGPEAASRRLLDGLRARASSSSSSSYPSSCDEEGKGNKDKEEEEEVDVSVGSPKSSTGNADGTGSASHAYSGHVSERKYVNMRLGAFIDAFEAAQEAEATAEPSSGMYLAQLPLYTAPSPEGGHHHRGSGSSCAHPGAAEGEVGGGGGRDIIIDWLCHPSGYLSSCDGFFRDKVLCNINCWINIGSAKSSLHYDAYHNLLVVLRGEKLVRMIPPGAVFMSKPSTSLSTAPSLRPEPAASASANHANYRWIDDAVRAGAVSAGAVLEARLGPGDCLLIPEGYWHEVVSAAGTIALNYWFLSPLGQLLRGGGGGTSLSLGMPALAMRHALGYMIEARRWEEAEVDRATAMAPTNPRMRRGAFRTAMLLCAGRPTRKAAAKALASRPHPTHPSANYKCAGRAERVVAAWRERFSAMDLYDMHRLWVPFASEHPAIWGAWLLSLSARQVCRILRTWEGERPSPDATAATSPGIFCTGPAPPARNRGGSLEGRDIKRRRCSVGPEQEGPGDACEGPQPQTQSERTQQPSQNMSVAALCQKLFDPCGDSVSTEIVRYFDACEDLDAGQSARAILADVLGLDIV